MRGLAVVIFGAAFLSAGAGAAYRYMCNGILANGTQRQDSCGPCEDEHAPRWLDSPISVLVGLKTTPKGFSADEWWQIVSDSFQAWENVPGTKLRFELIKGEGPREFGTNESVHELFVINNAREWALSVGSEHMGVLAVTKPKYNCLGDPKGNPHAAHKRQIVDSDMVINGTDFIKWKVNCREDDCFDPRAMLVHEIGHWLGLDHPCLVCNSSIMSALSGSNLIYPVFDDMQGIRALYSDNSRGGFGFPCENHTDCNKNICLLAEGNKYCTNICQEDRDCHAGSICHVVKDKKVCIFTTGETIVRKNVGDNCDARPCLEPLVCAGRTNNGYYCFQSCLDRDLCATNQRCMSLKESSICVTIRKLGESCARHELCADKLFCDKQAGQGYCRAPCSPNTGCPAEYSCKLRERAYLCIPDSMQLRSGSSDLAHIPNPNKIKVSPARSGCNMASGADNFLIVWNLITLLLLRLIRP